MAVCMAALATAVVGCGRHVDLPPMAKATGTVTYNGKTLTHGMVQFVPADAKLPTAVGYIDSTGHYEMRTAGELGAPVGQHTAIVECREEVDLNKTSWANTLIPERFADPKRSGLPVTVKANEDNDIPLQLPAK